MAAIAIRVVGISLPGPCDMVQVDCSVVVYRALQGFSVGVFVPFDAPAADVDAAIIATAVAQAIALGHNVGPGDRRLLFGGASE